MDWLLGRSLRARLTDGELRELADAIEIVHVSPGARLITRGERVHFVSLVHSGEVELYRLAGRGRVVYEILRRGDLLGAVPFLTRRPSAFSARALTPVSLLEIDGGRLEELLASRPGLAQAFVRALAQRLDRLERRLGELINGDLRSRVAALLLGETEVEEGLIRLSQSTLAELLGASRPRVNRILKEFERGGLVRLTYRRVEILDPEGLHRIAS